MKNIIYSPGEPAGIGPDLIIKLSLSKLWNKIGVPIITIGDKDLFEARAKLLNKKVEIIKIDDLSKAKKNQNGAIQIFELIKCNNIEPGVLDTSNAEYVLKNLNFAIKACISNKSDALVTGPISKENIISIGDSKDECLSGISLCGALQPKLWVNYVFLDNLERQYFASKPHCYLIDQLNSSVV